jgi:hypothetical protein
LGGKNSRSFQKSDNILQLIETFCLKLNQLRDFAGQILANGRFFHGEKKAPRGHEILKSAPRRFMQTRKRRGGDYRA